MPRTADRFTASHGLVQTPLWDPLSGRTPVMAPKKKDSSWLRKIGKTRCLVAVRVRLERPLNRHADVLGLLLAQLGHAGAQRGEVQGSHLLVQLLGQEVHIVLVVLGLSAVLQDVQLGQDLVREGARHHEGRVAGGTAEVHEPARGKNDHAVAIREDEAIHLRLDVLHLDARELLQVLHGNLVVEVADVAHDGVVLHLLHVLQGHDLEVARGRGEDVHLTHALLDGHHLETLHARLQRADGVDLRDEHSCTCATHGKGTALAHVSVAGHKGTLAADHHVRGPHDAVRQGVAAAVDVVELALPLLCSKALQNP